MARKLFCQISPLTYRISTARCIAARRIRDLFAPHRFARTRRQESLPHTVYRHRSLIRRQLGNTEMHLQENKAVNLALAAPRLDGICIRPGETFSFWRLVGAPTARRGYREGLTIAAGAASSGIGGGMCQMTNLIHWMVLHSRLEITEHHHHDGLDLFPDFGRVVPFGTGTSIVYNYLDYRVHNPTDRTYQLRVWVDVTHLCGELRADGAEPYAYHIEAENEHFTREGDGVYRNGAVYRRQVDRRTGNTLSRVLLQTNHARVCYDTAGLTVIET